MMHQLKTYRWEWILVALVVVAIVWSSLLSPYFLNIGNVLNSAQFFVMFGLMAFGLMPIIIQGEIDISLTSTLAVSAVVLAKFSVAGVPVWIGLPLALLLCALLGAINGVLVAVLGLPSLAVTLGTMGAYRGIAYLIGGADGVSGISAEYTWLGAAKLGMIPLTIILLVIVAGLFAVLMNTTTFGRYSYAIGQNRRATITAGIPVTRSSITSFALGGAMAGLAGLLWVAQYQAARGDNADGAILLVLTAVVLGGVSIKGGAGRTSGVFLAIVLLAVIQAGMRLANVPGTSQTLVTGALLILSVGIPLAADVVRAGIHDARLKRRSQLAAT